MFASVENNVSLFFNPYKSDELNNAASTNKGWRIIQLGKEQLAFLTNCVKSTDNAANLFRHVSNIKPFLVDIAKSQSMKNIVTEVAKPIASLVMVSDFIQIVGDWNFVWSESFGCLKSSETILTALRVTLIPINICNNIQTLRDLNLAQFAFLGNIAQKAGSLRIYGVPVLAPVAAVKVLPTLMVLVCVIYTLDALCTRRALQAYRIEGNSDPDVIKEHQYGIASRITKLALTVVATGGILGVPGLAVLSAMPSVSAGLGTIAMYCVARENYHHWKFHVVRKGMEKIS